MMRSKEHVTADEQVEDLRERMRMLQGDRKANIDILEANKAANKEEVKLLRDENKDLRLRLSQLQRAGSEGTDEAAEIESLQREVCCAASPSKLFRPLATHLLTSSY
jgi:uncharacterized protein YigA (DUF484 family)